MTAVLFTGGLAYAHGEYGQGYEGGASACLIASKLEMKSGVLLKHKDDLSLSEEQINTIKQLALAAQKSEIRQRADQKLFSLDLRTKMHEENLNVQEINALIDKNTAALADAAKANVAAYAKLKEVLTAEQKKKLEELKKEMKEKRHEKHDRD